MKAVLFDLGNTLVSYYTRAEFPGVLRRCLGTALRAAQSAQSSEDLFAQALELNRESRDFSVRPLADRLSVLIPGFASASDAWKEEISRAFMAPIFECASLDDSALPVLDELGRRGIRTAIVSNTPWGSSAQLWREELDRHGLLPRVHAAVFCVDTGWRKPHPAAIHRALDLLHASSSEAMFIGDDLLWDIEGARRAGVQPVCLCRDNSVSEIDCTTVSDLRAVVDLV